MLLDVSLIHFVVNSLSQLKSILGLADQRAHASTFECVRLCSEGKISAVKRLLQKAKNRANSSLQNASWHVRNHIKLHAGTKFGPYMKII